MGISKIFPASLIVTGDAALSDFLLFAAVDLVFPPFFPAGSATCGVGTPSPQMSSSTDLGFD
jgi:hypothetical protein